MSGINNVNDLTPENIAQTMFNQNADPFGTISDLKRVAGVECGMDIIDLQQEFSMELTRGKLTRDEAIVGFTKKLEENAINLGLN